uniref:Vezatin n=1 Tax=Parascaris univalens TaxID=6257 RepID=A0A915C9Q2_PARUN
MARCSISRLQLFHLQLSYLQSSYLETSCLQRFYLLPQFYSARKTMNFESEVDVELIRKDTVRTKNPLSINPSIILPPHTLLDMGNSAIASGIMDGLDADIVAQSLAVFPCRDRSSLWKISSCIVVCCLAISTAVTTWPYTLLATILCIFVTFTMVKALSSFLKLIVAYCIRSAKIFDGVVQQIFSAIRCGEITSFGLLRKGEKKRIYMYALRVEFLEMLRKIVDEEHNASLSLCRDEENETLLWAVLTPEMAELARSGYFCEKFITLSSLKELWQLYFLLRSEFIRLLFLTLLESSIFEAFGLLFRWYRRANQISRCSQKLLAISRFVKQQNVSDDSERKKRAVIPTIGTLNKARVQLQIAFELLDCKAENEDTSDIVIVLNEVIRMLDAGLQQTRPKVQVELNAEQNSRTDENGTEHAKVIPSHAAPPVISVDQASKEVHEVARSVVHELESALEDRKREMRERERAALARFYEKTVGIGGTSCSLPTETTDENEALDSLQSASTSDLEGSEDIAKRSAEGYPGVVGENSSERSETEWNPTAHRSIALAWGNGLEEMLRLRSSLPQEHFEDTGSGVSELDIVASQC